MAKQYYLRAASLMRADLFRGELVAGKIIGGKVRAQYLPHEVYLVPRGKVAEVRKIISSLQKAVKGFKGDDVARARHRDGCGLAFGEQIREALSVDIEVDANGKGDIQPSRRMVSAGENPGPVDLEL